MLKSGNQSDNLEFAMFLGCLRGFFMYEQFSPTYFLLARKLNQCSVRVEISELAELAREVYFKNRAGTGEGRVFRDDVLAAVIELQNAAVTLFQLGQNDRGYMLLVSDEDVHWAGWREGIKNHLAST